MLLGSSSPTHSSIRRILAFLVLFCVILTSVIVSQPSVKAALIRLLSRRGISRSNAAAAAAAARKRRRRALAVAKEKEEALLTNAPSVSSDGLPIPNIVHFIFGLESGFGHIKFGLLHYLAILGAAIAIQPDEIRWHYIYLPEGIWWECARPHLTFHKVEDVTHVHGKPRPMRVQHKADILRMQIMLNEGGMYIDSDVVPLRSFQELRRQDLVMGQESTSGLCNAVMLGKPNTTFINRWWAEYVHFDPEKQWAYHSVILPRQLAAQHPSEVTVLGPTAFFAPTWEQLTAMYDRDDGYDYHDNYAVHLWTSADPNKQEMLRKLSIRDLFTAGGSFQRVMRKLLARASKLGRLCPYAEKQVRYFMETENADGVVRDWMINASINEERLVA